jgi:hypothetical protein
MVIYNRHADKSVELAFFMVNERLLNSFMAQEFFLAVMDIRRPDSR